MLAVVNLRRTQNTEPVSFKIEGSHIPKFVLVFLESAFPNAVRFENEDDEAYTKLEDWEWYKEISAKMTPGERIRADRGLRNWTQKVLAQKLGVPVQNVSEMERNVRPISRKMAQKLGEIFGTSPNLYFKV